MLSDNTFQSGYFFQVENICECCVTRIVFIIIDPVIKKFLVDNVQNLLKTRISSSSSKHFVRGQGTNTYIYTLDVINKNDLQRSFKYNIFIYTLPKNIERVTSSKFYSPYSHFTFR